MRDCGRFLLNAITVLMCTGCSTTVAADRVYGTYVASYPFGTDTITLNRDGTFEQRVMVSIRLREPIANHRKPELPSTGRTTTDSPNYRLTYACRPVIPRPSVTVMRWPAATLTSVSTVPPGHLISTRSARVAMPRPTCWRRSFCP